MLARAVHRCGAARHRALSAAAVRFAEVDEAALPEGCGAIGRESDVIEGKPLVVERAATAALWRAAEAAAGVDAGAPVIDALEGDVDWTCPGCGFATFSSKSFRIACAGCGAPRPAAPPRDAYLLTGPRGCGKSVALASLVAKARANGWLALYAPRGFDVANAGNYVVPSPHHQGKFEEPTQARSILAAFHAAHAGDLADVPVRDGAAGDRWSARHLGELLDAALEDKRLDENGTALADVRGALGACVEKPVLVAIDEYTALFEPKSGYWFDNVNLAPTDVVSIDALRTLDAAGVRAGGRLARGVQIFADSVSRGPASLDGRGKRLSIAHGPFELKLAAYDDAEFDAALDRYRAAGYFSAPLDAGQVRELKMQTQRNPQHLFDRLALADFNFA